MRIQAYDDAKAFRDAVEPYLARDEPRHNLIYGLASTLVDHPEVYPVHHCRRIVADGEPVSWAGFAGPTKTGMRIGPVYTPPEKRGRGYATALVASLSREMLSRDRRFCFLYTDMANPTSNAIYRRIGYRLVCGSAMIHFTP